jgi:hypothetical protein
LDYFITICSDQLESRLLAILIALRLEGNPPPPPMAHHIHLLSSLKFGGKNPVTWLQSRNGAVWRQLLPAGMNEVMLPDGGGKVVPSNSEDLTSSEGVTYTSQCSYFSVCFSIQYLFCFAFPRKFSNYVSRC